MKIISVLLVLFLVGLALAGPTAAPTRGPTAAPTRGPTANPTAAAAPTRGPTANPTAAAPTRGPTAAAPTAVLTAGPPPAGPTAGPAGPTAGPPPAGPTAGPAGPTAGPPPAGPTAGPPPAGPTAGPPPAGPTAGPAGPTAGPPPAGPTAGPPPAGPTAGPPPAGPTAGPPPAGPTAGPVNPPPAGPTAGPVNPPPAGPTAGPVNPPPAGPTAGPVNPPPAGPTAGPVNPPPAGPTAGPVNPPPAGPTAGPVGPPAPVPQSGAAFVPPPAATQQFPFTVVANEAAVDNLPPGAYALVNGQVVQNAPEGFQNKAAPPPALFCGDGIISASINETCETSNPCCKSDCSGYVQTESACSFQDESCRKSRCRANASGSLANNNLFTCVAVNAKTAVLATAGKKDTSAVNGTICGVNKVKKVKRDLVLRGNKAKQAKAGKAPKGNSFFYDRNGFRVDTVVAKPSKPVKQKFCNANAQCTCIYNTALSC